MHKLEQLIAMKIGIFVHKMGHLESAVVLRAVDEHLQHSF